MAPVVEDPGVTVRRVEEILRPGLLASGRSVFAKRDGRSGGVREGSGRRTID